MILKKSSATTLTLILVFGILFAAGAAVAAPQGRWSGTVASVAGDDLASSASPSVSAWPEG